MNRVGVDPVNMESQLSTQLTRQNLIRPGLIFKKNSKQNYFGLTRVDLPNP
jgi:hypothetical protein